MKNFKSNLTLLDLLILLQNILHKIAGKKMVKDKTDIFKKQHNDGIIDQIFFLLLSRQNFSKSKRKVEKKLMSIFLI